MGLCPLAMLIVWNNKVLLKCMLPGSFFASILFESLSQVTGL